MIAFNLEEFLARSTDRAFSETTLASVLKDLPGLYKDGPWLAGGALRRTVQGGEPDSDFDFFFRDQEQLDEFAKSLEFMGLTKVRTTDHHVHYRGQVAGKVRDIQCIKFAFYRDAAAVIDSFDYTVCMFAFDGTTLTCGDFALWDLGRKRLAIHKITYPVATMRRMIKYTSQGLTACKGCLATILKATATSPQLLSQLDIEYVD